MSPFPDEILTNILFRLPVKCLLRSRSVSKFWLALIDSSYFVKLHLNRSLQTKTNLFFISQSNGDLFRVPFDSIEEEEDCVVQPVEDDDPYNNIPQDSCHGLFCMSDGSSKAGLWNPSTKKYIQLPYTRPFELYTIGDENNRDDLHFTFKICYDNTNDDYKVVRLSVLEIGIKGNDIIYEVKIYSLKSNSWHKIELDKLELDNCIHCPYFDGTGDPIVIASKALHWISDVTSVSRKESSIVAFDLGTERYRVIPKPEFGGLDPFYYYLHLHNLGGCLSLSCEYESYSVDIFLLKDYGENTEYWSKLVTMVPKISFAPLFCVRPISYSKSGKRVLLEVDFEKLIWYNLKQESFEEIRVHGMDRFCKVLTCVESLVSVDVATATTNANAKKNLPEKEENNI